MQFKLTVFSERKNKEALWQAQHPNLNIGADVSNLSQHQPKTSSEIGSEHYSDNNLVPAN